MTKASAVWMSCCLCLLAIIAFNAWMWGTSAHRADLAERRLVNLVTGDSHLSGVEITMDKAPAEKPVATVRSTGFVPGLQVGPWGPQRVTREYDSVGLRVGPTLGVMTPAYAHTLATALNKMADEVEADTREERGR